MASRTGSITDVDGVLVGHHQRRTAGWRTGTSVVFAPEGAVAAVDVRGGGPGTRETDALDARNLVDRVHAICLTGGSAYGLAAADGVMAELEQRGLGVPVGTLPGQVVPVVPAAVIFDLGRGGNFANRPDAEFGRRAIRAATGRTDRGSIGAGTGARAGWLQGGVGTASTTVDLGGTTATIGAIAVVNAAGAVIDEATGLPWLPRPDLRRPSAADRRRLAAAVATARSPTGSPLNTTIGVVATDVELTRPEAGRLAQSGHDGLARAVRPAHLMVDGDTVFAMATGRAQPPTERPAHLDLLFTAAAEVFGAACVDAVVNATATGADPAYRDLCPSAYRQ